MIRPPLTAVNLPAGRLVALSEPVRQSAAPRRSKQPSSPPHAMSAQLIDGKSVAAEVRDRIRLRVADRLAAGKRPPGLAVILVGDDPASSIYVRNKRVACEEAGFVSRSYDLPGDTRPQALFELIDELNEDDAVDGILVQLPLPEGIDQSKVIERILGDFPDRRFVLVGDSGEQDPEIYAALARKHPGQIVCILVRSVDGSTREDPRFGAAFEGIPGDRWRVFGAAGELGEVLPPVPPQP